jgi:hypothetical protein
MRVGLKPAAALALSAAPQLHNSTLKFRGGAPTSYERALDIGNERR